MLVFVTCAQRLLDVAEDIGLDSYFLHRYDCSMKSPESQVPEAQERQESQESQENQESQESQKSCLICLSAASKSPTPAPELQPLAPISPELRSLRANFESLGKSCATIISTWSLCSFFVSRHPLFGSLCLQISEQMTPELVNHC
jgi:hypothetical protein